MKSGGGEDEVAGAGQEESISLDGKPGLATPTPTPTPEAWRCVCCILGMGELRWLCVDEIRVDAFCLLDLVTVRGS